MEEGGVDGDLDGPQGGVVRRRGVVDVVELGDGEAQEDAQGENVAGVEAGDSVVDGAQTTSNLQRQSSPLKNRHLVVQYE